MAVERKIKHLKYSQNEYKKSVQVVIIPLRFTSALQHLQSTHPLVMASSTNLWPSYQEFNGF